MPSINTALTIAQAYTWDETHGYALGGMGRPTFDCSGFVGICLNEAGFNYPGYPTHIGTLDMHPRLLVAGFNALPYNNLFVPKHGDIFVMNHGSNGHTFFYAENVQGYTDYTGRTNTVGLLAHAKIEASSSRTSGYSYADGDPGTQPGDINNPNTTVDYPRNGTGAHWEVWTHAYYSLIDRSTYPNDSDITVYRYPYNDNDAGALAIAMIALTSDKRHKRRF